MFCEQCGKKLEENSDFCIHCGTKFTQKDARLDVGSRRTLSSLNGRVWYRFLKVSFVLVLAGILIFGNIVILFDDVVGFKNIDSEKTEIVCNNKGNKTFPLSEVAVTLSASDFKDGEFNYKGFFKSSSYDIEEILKRCLDTIDEIDVYGLQKVQEFKRDKGYPSVYTEQDNSDLNGELNRMARDYDKTKYLNYSVELFDIIPRYTYREYLIAFLILNLGTIVTFEILRRIFYYVVLGTLRPRKQ